VTVLALRGGHKCGRLFVVDEHETHAVLLSAQPLHNPVGPIAREPKDGVDAPVRQSVDEQVRCHLGHSVLPVRSRAHEMARRLRSASRFRRRETYPDTVG
jgi:hypothetical protein